MKDAQSAEQFRVKLEAMKANGLFRDKLPGIDPKQPVNVEINFLTSGNYLLMAGSKDWVDRNLATVQLMGFLFERPRAHLQLNLRVVQLTGPANTEVIQMSETVRALVEAQREEIVRTFGDLNEYLTGRLAQRRAGELHVYQAVCEVMPALANGQRPLTVPETLMLLMLDRSSPAPRNAATTENQAAMQDALLELPRVLNLALGDKDGDEAQIARDIQDELAIWKKAVAAGRDWCAHYADELKKAKDPSAIGAFRAALDDPNSALPHWLARRMGRSLELTERLYPNLVRRHTEQSVRELHRRFTIALQQAEKLEQALGRGEMMMTEPATTKQPAVVPVAAEAETEKQEGEKPEQPRAPREPNAAATTTGPRRTLLALKSLAEEMVPTPLALYESISTAADSSAPTPKQIIQMFREYSEERRKLETRLAADNPEEAKDQVNYAKMQALEASLNLWLRRTSEAMGRSLDQQFYRRYTNELRLLANKQLGKTSNRDLLMESNIDEVPDVARDLLLADNGVNIFVSNSISMQFSPETTNSVSAQVQAQLPSKLGILERLQQAETATRAFNTLSQAFGISGESVVKALLAGGQAVPVQGGITLSATPSIGFDGGSVSLALTANQTLAPGNDKVADRVTNHTINNATINALSYEPMVLSTLASNVSYFENTGGIPGLRKVPIVKSILKDIPLAPFKEGKRTKGVYQSSVIILEPVVIPTIEDLVRFHGGWREGSDPPSSGVVVKVNPN
jgi:hypothetical protein